MKNIRKIFTFILLTMLVCTPFAFTEAAGVSAFEQTETVDNVVISLSAPKGVFPEGSYFEAVQIKADKETSDALEEARDSNVTVQTAYTFDIKVFNKKGIEIEPDTKYGSVSVSFSMEELENTNLEPAVYHIVEEDGDVTAEKLESDVISEENTADELVIETDSFSTYQVEFTYNEIIVTMKGDSVRNLSEILSLYGITGTIEKAEGSNDELFRIDSSDSIWTVTALKEFHTDEWLKVTVDGTEYEIKVTDASTATCTVINNASQDITVTISGDGSGGPASGSYTISANSTRSFTYTDAAGQAQCRVSDTDNLGNYIHCSTSGNTVTCNSYLYTATLVNGLETSAKIEASPSFWIGQGSSATVVWDGYETNVYSHSCSATGYESCRFADISNGGRETIFGTMDEYLVSYKSNGGSSTPASQWKQYWKELTLQPGISHDNTYTTLTASFNGNGGSTPSDVTTTKTTTYTFTKWKDSDGNLYSGEGAYNNNEATTMTAQWSTDASYTTFTFPSTSRYGYDFAGWKNESGEIHWAGDTYEPHDNTTWTAQWTPQQRDITITYKYDEHEYQDEVPTVVLNFGSCSNVKLTKTNSSVVCHSYYDTAKSGISTSNPTYWTSHVNNNGDDLVHDNATATVTVTKNMRTIQFCGTDDYNSDASNTITWSTSRETGQTLTVPVNGCVTSAKTWTGYDVTVSGLTIIDASGDGSYHTATVDKTTVTKADVSQSKVKITNTQKTKTVTVNNISNFGDTVNAVKFYCDPINGSQEHKDGTSRNIATGASATSVLPQGVRCYVSTTQTPYYENPLFENDSNVFLLENNESDLHNDVEVDLYNYRAVKELNFTTNINTDADDIRSNIITIELNDADNTNNLNKMWKEDEDRTVLYPHTWNKVDGTYDEATGTVVYDNKAGVNFSLTEPDLSGFTVTQTGSESTAKYYNTQIVKNSEYNYTINNTRKTSILTFNVYNDNGYQVTDTVTIIAYDIETGRQLDGTSVGDFTGGVAEKQITVNAHSSGTLTFSVPEGTHLEISAVNNAGTSGFSGTDDYITIVETPEMYSGTTDEERVSYRDELGKDYIVFKSQEDDSPENRETMVIDNQYQRASFGFTSDNSITAKLYECLSESCTVKYTVQDTQHDASYNYYAETVSSEVDGESKYLASITGTSGQWTNQLDVHKTYKIVQENLILDRFYSWDSGYALNTTDYTGYNTGAGTLELNHKSRTIKVDVNGVEYEPSFAGNTVKMGSGGAVVTSEMKQPYTEVTVKAVTGSNVPVADVEMYFGAATDAVEANENIYIAAPTTKSGITFKSGSTAGKALQPDIDYTGFLGGSWVTDNSGNHVPFNGYLSDESWYKKIELPMAHYQDEDEEPTDFNLVIDTAKLTLKAKADAGNLNAVFNVKINNAQYTYGEDGTNGEMIRSSSFIVMHLGEDIDTCTGSEINKVCKGTDGYYYYTLDVPTDKLITVKHLKGNAEYYSVRQTCDVDAEKYACVSYVAEDTTDDHTDTFDFTRKTSTLDISSEIQDVQTDRNIISTITIALTDNENVGGVCTAGTYCNEWNETYDWSEWSELNSDFADIEYNNGNNTVTVTLNPETDEADETSIIIPAGMNYTVTASARENGGFISNFLNGLFKNNAGYKSTVEEGANGLSVAGTTGNIRTVINSYQYSRIEIISNTISQFRIENKDGDLVDNVAFASAGSANVDLAYDEAPYTFTQIGFVNGYYPADGYTLATVEQDGSYTVDMSQDEIEYKINVYASNGSVMIPVTDIGFAIGKTDDNIIFSGVLDSSDYHIGSEAGLEAGETYHIYLDGNVQGSTVTDYYKEKEFTVPANSPDTVLPITVAFASKSLTINTDELYGEVDIAYKLDTDREWTWGDIEDGISEGNISDGDSKTFFLPEGIGYEVTAPYVKGYHTEITGAASGTADDDIVLDFATTPYNFTVRLDNYNSEFNEIKVEGAVYGIFDLDGDAEVVRGTSDVNGEIELTAVYGHDYVIRQISAPYGYGMMEDEISIELPDDYAFADPDMRHEIRISNEAKHYILNIDTVNDEFADVRPEGIEYLIHDINKDEDILSCYSDTNGHAEFELVYGHEYSYYQGEMPYGYKTDGHRTAVKDILEEQITDFDEDNNVVINETAVPYEYRVNITSVNKEYDDTFIEGIEYGVHDAVTGNEIFEVTTDADGKCYFILTYGHDYYYVEKNSIYGYKDIEGNQNIPLEQIEDFETDEIFISQEVEPYHYTVKADSFNSVFNEIKVSDIKYLFYDATTGECIGLVESDENGIAMKELVYGHDYYFEQSESVYGYNDDENRHDINNGTLQEQIENFEDDPVWNLTNALVPYEYVINVDIVNETFNDIPVENAEYTLYDLNDYTDVPNEEPVFEEAEPVEPVEPENTCVKGLAGYKACKADYDEAKELYDAKLLIYNSEKNAYDLKKAKYELDHAWWVENPTTRVYKELETKTSDENGNIVYTVTYGHNYRLIEKTAPYGYEPDTEKYDIDIRETYPDYDFADDDSKFQVSIEHEASTYSVRVRKLDDSGNEVKGVEYTVYDETLSDSENKVIASIGCDNPVKKTNSDGYVEFILTYGHDYFIEETETVSGYDLTEGSLDIEVPENYDFKEKENIDIIPENPGIGHTFKLSVNGYDSRTGSALARSYELDADYTKSGSTVTKKLADINGDSTINVKYSQKYSYVVRTYETWEYYKPADQKADPSFNKDGKIQNVGLSFSFSPKDLYITVKNTVSGTKVTLYDYGTNNAVATVKATGTTAQIKTVYGHYYLKAVHPDGYDADNTSYSIWYDNMEFVDEGCKVTVTLKNSTSFVFGAKVTLTDEDGKAVSGKKVAIVSATTGKTVNDVNGKEATAVTDSKGQAKFYLLTSAKYAVALDEEETDYIISEKALITADSTVTKLSKSKFDSSKIEKYAEVNVKLEKAGNEDNDEDAEAAERLEKKIATVKKDINNGCDEARAKINAIWAEYDENDYSSEVWEKLVAIYNNAMKDIDSYCDSLIEQVDRACTTEEGCVTIEFDFSEIVQQFEIDCSEIATVKISLIDRIMSLLNGHLHWIAVAIGIITIIINAICKGGKGGLITAVIGILLAAATLLVDRCFIDIAAVAVTIILNIAILIIFKLTGEYELADEDESESEGE